MPESLNPAPVVSVCIFAYNHAPYIRQAVESVLAQQTTFPLEILIGEDGSTDDTPNILKQLQAENPGRIEILFQDQSKKIYIDGQPTGRYNFITTLQTARGKYIALLDGDDYWTDPLKLQKQVDFLEQHPEYTISTHNVTVSSFEGFRKHPLHSWTSPRSFSFTDLIEKNFISTVACLFRRRFDQYPNWMLRVRVGDWPLHLLHAEQGPIHYSPECMAVYRKHAGGIWSAMSPTESINTTINLLYYLDNVFEGRYHTEFQKAIEKRKTQLLNSSTAKTRLMAWAKYKLERFLRAIVSFTKG